MLVSETEALSGEVYDVAVIGAGVIGVFAAVQLEKAGLRVALIEGGGATPDTVANGVSTRVAGRPHSSVTSGRAMGVGGTGLLWGGQLSELGPADLEGAKGFWPIDYAALRRLYDRTYAALGLSARLPDAAARARFGGDEGVVDGVERIFSYWLPNPNLAAVFRAILARSDRLTLVPGHKAIGFDFGPDGAAQSVRARGDDRTITVRARTFVIAAGVVESSRLALAAGRDPRCPWRDNRCVGATFQDHLGGNFGTLVPSDERTFRERFETGFVARTKYMPKLRYTARSVAGISLSVCAFPVFHSSMAEHVANVKLLMKAIRSGSVYARWRDLPTSMVRVGGAFLPLVRRYARDRRVFALMDKGVTLAFQGEQAPIRTSRITLADDISRDGLPTAIVDWRVSGEEGPFLQAAARHFSSYFTASGVALLTLRPEFENGDPGTVIEGLWDTSHPGGGLCMGESATTGATDPQGRLWGSRNVFAAGASTMATSGEANITLTALAMTLRLTDHLATTADTR